MRALLGFTLTIAVLLGAALLADELLASRAERQIEQYASDQLGAPTDVRLDGFPVGLRLLFNRVPEATLSAGGVPIPGREARITDLEVQLTDARFSAADLARGAELPLRAERATFRAELDGPALLALADAPPLLQGIDLIGGELRFVLGVPDLGTVTPSATVGVRDGDLVLRPSAGLPAGVGGLAELVVPLDGLPAGAVVSDARVQAGRLVLTGSVTNVLLTPPAPPG